ncbi:MAG: hypothetical protein ACRDSL_21690 [Pseudonocardiaceae bacterium]
MSTAVVIGLGILAWVLVAIMLALFLGRVVQLRDRQCPDRTEPGEPAGFRPGQRADVTSVHAPVGWDRRHQT